MKTQLLMFLLLVSTIPQVSIASSGCNITSGVCYDLSLEINVGDELNWIVYEHLTDSVPFDYGVDSEEPLVVTLKIIKDFRGSLYSDIYDDPVEYFSIIFSVDGKNTNINPSTNWFSDNGNFPWTNILIEPTLVVNSLDNYTLNRFEQLLQEPLLQVSRTSTLETATSLEASIVNETFIRNRHVIDTRLNDSFIQYDYTHEVRLNILSGLLEQETENRLYFGKTQEENRSYYIEYDRPNPGLSISTNTQKNNTATIELNRIAIIAVSVAVVAVAMLGVFVFIMRSKIE